MKQHPKITFGLVIYNEEALLARCLESIKDVADEIIIVHDGPCTDRSLEIAAQYNAIVHIGERFGGSDPHRVYILENATHEWIFMIDADEFLSSELREYIKGESAEWSSYGVLAVHWPLWDGERYVTYSNWRTVLYDRSKCWTIALHNFPVQTVGEVLKKPLILEHKPKDSKVGLSRIFHAQTKRRVDMDAAQFVKGYDALAKYHEHLIPDSFVDGFTTYVRHSKRAMILQPVKHFLGSLKHNWKDGWHGVSISIVLAAYQFSLARTISQMKKNKT